MIATCLMMTMACGGFARKGDAPRSLSANVQSSETIGSVTLPAIDAAALRAQRDKTASKAEPFRVAKPIDVSITLDKGTWETLADGGRLWRVRIDSPGALHLNFGFGRFKLPDGATLHIHRTDDADAYIGPYTAADNAEHGLWTPMVPGDSAVIELYVPARASEPVLEVTRVGAGFHDLSNR